MKTQHLVLLEALGIPDRLLQINRLVFDKFLKSLEYESSVLSKYDNLKITDRDQLNYSIGGDYQIADYYFSNVAITMNAEIMDNLITDRPLVFLRGLGYELENPALNATNTRIIRNKPSGNEVSLQINFITNSIAAWTDVFDYIEKNKKSIYTSLAHELKHAYDWYKSGGKGTKIGGLLRYRTASEQIGLPLLDDFNHNVYFTANMENLVRPSEIAAELEYDGVTQALFLQAFRESDVYKKLKEIENSSYEQLRQNMINDSKTVASIASFLDSEGYNPLKMSAEEIVDEMLKINHKVIMGKMLQDYNMQVAYKGISDLFPSKEIAQARIKAHKEVEDEIKRFENNPVGFYQYEFKKMKQDAQIVLKKLAKVYAYLPK